MKSIFISFFFILFSNLVFSQDIIPNKNINGSYNLLYAEKGINNKPTKTKLFEFGDHNGAKLIAIAACAKCMPAVYSYKEEESKELGRAVFFNSMGLYLFQYDEDSFIIVMIDPNKDDWTDFYYSNFYSKSQSKVDSMSKEKIKEFVIDL